MCFKIFFPNFGLTFSSIWPTTRNLALLSKAYVTDKQKLPIRLGFFYFPLSPKLQSLHHNVLIVMRNNHIIFTGQLRPSNFPGSNHKSLFKLNVNDILPTINSITKIKLYSKTPPKKHSCVENLSVSMNYNAKHWPLIHVCPQQKDPHIQQVMICKLTPQFIPDRSIKMPTVYSS